MPTGANWNTDNPAKPWADFDTNAQRTIPFEVEDWLAEMGTTYAGHEVIAPAPLELVDDPYDPDLKTIAITIKVADGASFTVGRQYPFTVRLTGADSQVDDRTLWLKLRNR